MLDTLIKRCYNRTAKQYCNKPLYEGSGFCTLFWVRLYNNSYSRDFQVLIVNFYFFVIINKRWGVIMEKMLERILSLIPKKPDGSFEHGALKAFAQSLGLKSGNLISDWMNGRSASYKNYVYKISSVYGVSVKWLKGETDEKKPSVPEDGGLDKISKDALTLFRQLWPENQQHMIEIAQSLLRAQESVDNHDPKVD